LACTFSGPSRSHILQLPSGLAANLQTKQEHNSKAKLHRKAHFIKGILIKLPVCADGCQLGSFVKFFYQITVDPTESVKQKQRLRIRPRCDIYCCTLGWMASMPKHWLR